MAVELETDDRQSVAALVSGIIRDARQLAHQQLTLLEVELKSDWRRTLQATLPLIMGLIICFVGLIIAALAIAHLLPAIWPQLPLWGALAIVGGCLLSIGTAATVIGRHLFGTFNPPPTETVQGLKENLQWKTHK